MTDEEFLTWLQSGIGYEFHEYYLLQTTLITPGFEGSKVGSEEEKHKYEGNRISAQLGDSLIPLVVRYQMLLIDGASRGSANNASTTITGRKHQEERAEFLGIKAHMKLNKRQNARADPTTLRLALCAIIGAVWLDCGQDFAVTTKVVLRLLIGPKLSPCIDPKALSSAEDVVTCPKFFDEWLHDYETPSETVPYGSLDVRADLSDSLYDLQIPSNDGPPTTVLDAQASYMENVNQSQQRAVEPTKWTLQLPPDQLLPPEKGISDQILGTQTEVPSGSEMLPMEYNAKGNLNASQNAAVEASLSYRLTCLRGPPGTGKTYTIVEIIKQLQASPGNGRILVTAPTHNAMDNVMRKYLADVMEGERLDTTDLIALRVSTDVRKVAEDLKKHTYDAMARKEIYTSHSALNKA
ncbi:hypothetical protein VE00_10678 [Pseudogymnoascus sp. WSF 3629]|nr:hypothetical protein VE00_10678 [Pseudogymnoascus sp. WSF 3629]